ncbi:hypothetical protein TWF481_011427 [Arthrobotrys musiformis]|uniref:Ribosome biogenesis protein NOP53 n=1 Tax=Arthrobotrys musiformis TaxID=47236 RepID=A0AAV9VY87_9PEZI
MAGKGKKKRDKRLKKRLQEQRMFLLEEGSDSNGTKRGEATPQDPTIGKEAENSGINNFGAAPPKNPAAAAGRARAAQMYLGPGHWRPWRDRADSDSDGTTDREDDRLRALLGFACRADLRGNKDKGLGTPKKKKPRYDAVADLERILAEGREEVNALRRVVARRQRRGESTGRLPELTEKLAQKMAELELYNSNEEARMHHAWCMARDHDRAAKTRAVAGGDERGEEFNPRARTARGYWAGKKRAADPSAGREAREEAASRRLREVAPIVAICQRTRYLSVEQRDHVGNWVLGVPEEMEGFGEPAPVPTTG